MCMCHMHLLYTACVFPVSPYETEATVDESAVSNPALDLVEENELSTITDQQRMW